MFFLRKVYDLLYQQTSPFNSANGRKWLAALESEECPQFRVYADYLCNGHGSWAELGTTEEAVLELALTHAEKAMLQCGHNHVVDVYIVNDLKTRLNKIRVARPLFIVKPAEMPAPVTEEVPDEKLAA